MGRLASTDDTVVILADDLIYFIKFTFLGVHVCRLLLSQQLENVVFVLVHICYSMDTLLCSGISCVLFCSLILHLYNLLQLMQS